MNWKCTECRGSAWLGINYMTSTDGLLIWWIQPSTPAELCHLLSHPIVFLLNRPSVVSRWLSPGEGNKALSNKWHRWCRCGLSDLWGDPCLNWTVPCLWWHSWSCLTNYRDDSDCVSHWYYLSSSLSPQSLARGPRSGWSHQENVTSFRVRIVKLTSLLPGE